MYCYLYYAAVYVLLIHRNITNTLYVKSLLLIIVHLLVLFFFLGMTATSQLILIITIAHLTI